MKKNITLIVVLMFFCVAGIIGLQLFWNYQNYKTTVRAFDHDINEALHQAVAKETDQRREQIVARFKGWLADTSLIVITADHKNRDSNTVFYTRDAHPKFSEDKNRKFEFGLTYFKEKLNMITPVAKAIMIEHFGNRIVRRDLKDGNIYHYTQMLGDSLEKVFNASRLSKNNLETLLKKELDAKDIKASFVLNPENKSELYLTRPVNTNFKKPYQKDLVFAGFESPNTYFVKEMKWAIITSLLLICITTGCFAYTVRTLFSQHKLVELKEAFVNNVTHELNTPIASIKITAEALKSFEYTPERQLEYLDIISYQADKLDEMTNQILSSTMANVSKVFTYEDIDLNILILSAIEDIKPKTNFYNASINYGAPTSGMQVKGSFRDLQNVMINLMDNALKYNENRPNINIEISSSAATATIILSDNGIGIAKEYQSAVFGQFFRIPQGNLHNVKGFGLGLSYVQSVLKQHSGEITLANNHPAGSKFTIKLPLA